MATATCMQPLHLVETSRNAKSSGSMQSTNPDSHAYHHRDDRRASGSSQQSQQRQRPRTQGQASPATTHIVPRHEKQHRSRRHERPDRGNGGADTRRAAAAGGSEKREQHQQQAYRRNSWKGWNNHNGYQRGARSNRSEARSPLEKTGVQHRSTSKTSSNSPMKKTLTSTPQGTASSDNKQQGQVQELECAPPIDNPSSLNTSTTPHAHKPHSSLDTESHEDLTTSLNVNMSTTNGYSNGFDIEDDEFMDALSSLSSDDENSSQSSSAFVTPTASRTPSLTLSPPSSPTSTQSNSLSMDTLTNSFTKLLQLQEESNSSMMLSLSGSDQHDSGLEETIVDDMTPITRKKRGVANTSTKPDHAVTNACGKTEDVSTLVDEELSNSKHQRLIHQPVALEYEHPVFTTAGIHTHVPSAIVTMAPHSPQSSFSSSVSPQSSFSTQSVSEPSTPFTSPSPSPQPEIHTPPGLMVDQLHTPCGTQTISNQQDEEGKDDEKLEEKKDEGEKEEEVSEENEETEDNRNQEDRDVETEDASSWMLVETTSDLSQFEKQDDCRSVLAQEDMRTSVVPNLPLLSNDTSPPAKLPANLSRLLHSVSVPDLPPLTPSLPTSPDVCIPPEVIPVTALEENLPVPPPPLALSVRPSLPLYHTWVMWFDQLTTGRPQFADYAASLNKLCAIQSVEEFWGVYNNIVPPSGLDKNSNYHFFKKGIKPLWEDSANEHGGKWVLTVKNNVDVLDKLWLELLMMLVGEQIDNSHLITGAVVSRRKKGDRIALWTRSKRNKNGNLHICKVLLRVIAQVLKVQGFSKFVSDLAEEKDGMSLVYMHHNDSLRSGTSYQNEARISLRDNLDGILSSMR